MWLRTKIGWFCIFHLTKGPARCTFIVVILLPPFQSLIKNPHKLFKRLQTYHCCIGFMHWIAIHSKPHCFSSAFAIGQNTTPTFHSRCAIKAVGIMQLRFCFFRAAAAKDKPCCKLVHGSFANSYRFAKVMRDWKRCWFASKLWHNFWRGFPLLLAWRSSFSPVASSPAIISCVIIHVGELQLKQSRWLCSEVLLSSISRPLSPKAWLKAEPMST